MLSKGEGDRKGQTGFEHFREFTLSNFGHLYKNMGKQAKDELILDKYKDFLKMDFNQRNIVQKKLLLEQATPVTTKSI